MSDTEEISLTLEQEDDYAFRIRFEGTDLEPLLTDEPEPVGTGLGPSPARLMLAGVANCLAASLLFALRKYKNEPGRLHARISATPERNADGRWRFARASVELQLAEGAETHQHIGRILQQFEDFCIVTQSVREGIDVSVTVKDAHGAILHGDPNQEAGS